MGQVAEAIEKKLAEYRTVVTKYAPVAEAGGSPQKTRSYAQGVVDGLTEALQIVREAEAEEAEK
jgi:hypothetical protein